jgi:hypothetical protein
MGMTWLGTRKAGKVWRETVKAADTVEEYDAENDKRSQELIENYMLLVNASFLLHHERALNATKFEFMWGLEFPGLWSRSLYNDTTDKKVYRNMLVGNRPRGVKCQKVAIDGWKLMLRTIRMTMNECLPAHKGLLLEYEDNLRYTLNRIENEVTT